ncbi:MAG TPA: ABC transporter ATP-binding protein [Microthrixaceae bacterium]|jgi:ABC-2 type transport system ATP-binding protein|nr:ABC transporter ATP-binding protein [Microthrixaceae bacterium]
MTQTLDPPALGVALRGLVKTFPSPAGPVQAVRGIDLDIACGETVALLGPNGAGKSSTIEMILGLSKPDAGTVDVLGLSPKQAIQRGAIGAMLQVGAVLGELSVRELVDMMGSLFPTPLGVDETLELAGIGDIAERRTNRLSGGQTQRVRFAVAMVSDPDLIILDEPTVAMDVESRVAFWATMRSFTERGKTVIFATHYLEEADDYADRIVLMARGEIVADGTAAELRAASGGRHIKAVLAGASSAALESLAGVVSATIHGEAIDLACADSDVAIRALLAAYPDVHEIEIVGAGLEHAFLELTGEAGGDR